MGIGLKNKKPPAQIIWFKGSFSWKLFQDGGIPGTEIQGDYTSNGCKIHMDILTRENLSTIWVANIDLIYWSVCSSSKRGGDEVNVVLFFRQLRVLLYQRT